MKFSRILAVIAVAATGSSMIGCAGPAGFSYQNTAITLTPFCENCPDGIIYNPAYPVPSPESGTFAIAIGAAGGTAGAAGAPALPNSVLLMPGSNGPGSTFWFQADVTNAAPNLTWNVYPTPDFGDITTLPSGTSSTEGGTAGNNVYSYGQIVSASGNVAYFYEPGGTPNLHWRSGAAAGACHGHSPGRYFAFGLSACRSVKPLRSGYRITVGSNIQYQRKPGLPDVPQDPDQPLGSHHQRCDGSPRHQLSVHRICGRSYALSHHCRLQCDLPECTVRYHGQRGHLVGRQRLRRALQRHGRRTGQRPSWSVRHHYPNRPLYRAVGDSHLWISTPHRVGAPRCSSRYTSPRLHHRQLDIGETTGTGPSSISGA